MSKAKLKRLRINFRNDVFERDGHKCVYCELPAEDAHHITDRHEMPNDGYVKENGISLCSRHHTLAEAFHQHAGTFWYKGYHPSDLYEKIGSSYELALAASKRLGDR